MSLGRLFSTGLAMLATLCSAIGAYGAFASEITVSTPGKTVVHDPAGDLLLLNCDRAQPRRPCTLPPDAARTEPGWIDIDTAEIAQIDAKSVEFAITARAPIPATPAVPTLIYYWQFQDGCNTTSPTDKDGVNVFWDGHEWTAHWFVISSCAPRQIAIGKPVPFRFEGNIVSIRVPLGELITRGGAPLLWFAGTRLVPFHHPRFTRSLPVDVAPDVVSIDPADPRAPLHREQPAPWIPR